MLLERRRTESKPHISYDIDGDGNVSAKDFFFARLFDKEKKGRLTDSERKECVEAVTNGSLNDKFVFIKHAEKTEGQND